MVILDAIWLSMTIKNFYSIRLAHLTAETPSYAPAIILYVLYALGLSILIILPTVSNNYSFIKIFFLGALFGLVAYASYDLTNQATLKNWPVAVTFIDMAWGAILSGVVSVISVYFTRVFS